MRALSLVRPIDITVCTDYVDAMPHDYLLDPHKASYLPIEGMQVKVHALKPKGALECIPILAKMNDLMRVEDKFMAPYAVLVEELSDAAKLIAHATDIRPSLEEFPDEPDPIKRAILKIEGLDFEALGILLKAVIAENEYFFECARIRATQEAALALTTWEP